jgi:hypothetical protein
MTNEDGLNTGYRNVGRFFLFAIPLVLGLAATVWFGLWVSGYEFQRRKAEVAHELTQQERAAVYVGAQVRPKGKLAVQLSQEGCFKIVRADLDTKKPEYGYGFEYSLLLYAQNLCTSTRHEYGISDDSGYREWHWAAISPNGVMLKEGYTNYECPKPAFQEIGECRFDIDPDDRIDHFKVWGIAR